MFQIRELKQIVQKERNINASYRLRFESHIGKTNAKRREGPLIKNIFVICCVIGCSYNAYQIVSSYLAYGVTAEAWFFSQEPVTPPMLTLCISEDYREGSGGYKFFNTSQEFFEANYNFSEKVYGIRVNQNPYGVQDILDSQQFEKDYVVTYTTFHWICYAINLTVYNGTLLKYPLSYIKSLNSRGMITFVLNSSVCFKGNSLCEFQVTSHKSYRLEARGTIVKGGLSNFIDYQEQQFRLLPKPYVTNCRDYQKEGLESLEDCIAKCLRARYLMQYGVVTLSSTVFKNENVSWSQKRAYPSNAETQICESKCSQIGCELDQFMVQVERTLSWEALPANCSKITLGMPVGNRLRVNYIAKIDFWDFLTLFGSVFGFWFGFSAFGLIDVVLKLEPITNFASYLH